MSSWRTIFGFAEIAAAFAGFADAAFGDFGDGAFAVTLTPFPPEAGAFGFAGALAARFEAVTRGVEGGAGVTAGAAAFGAEVLFLAMEFQCVVENLALGFADPRRRAGERTEAR